jgi:hypothetical protein
MAKIHGVSAATAQRIWSARGPQSHRVRTFELSHDPRSEEKLVDLGLYLNPPENAIVLAMDEKSQIQALRLDAAVAADQARIERGTMTRRLQVQRDDDPGRRLGRAHRLGDRPVPPSPPPHRVPEVLDQEIPDGLQVHLILDNYATHKHETVNKWLTKHPPVPPALHDGPRALGATSSSDSSAGSPTLHLTQSRT